MAHIRPRGPRSYEIRVYLGRWTDGKKKYLIETFKGTKGGGSVAGSGAGGGAPTAGLGAAAGGHERRGVPGPVVGEDQGHRGVADVGELRLVKKFPGRTVDKALNDGTDFCTTVAEWCRGQMDKLL